MKLKSVKVTGIIIGLVITLLVTKDRTYAAGISEFPAAGMGVVFEEGVSVSSLSSRYMAGSVPSVVQTAIASSVNKTDSSVLDKKEADSSELDEYKNLVIAQVDNYVNIRSLPNIDSEVVGKLYDKSVGELISDEGEWIKITSGNCTGYVKAEYVVSGNAAQELIEEVSTTYAVVNTTTLFIREEPSLDASIIGMFPFEEELLVEEKLEGWVKVSTVEGDGYVSSDFVTLRTELVEAESSEEEAARLELEATERAKALATATAARQAKAATTTKDKTTNTTPAPSVVSATGSDMGNAVAEYALQFVGNPYVYGGTSLTNGTDCSGFTQSLYANYGISLPRTSSSQRSVGTEINGIENALPGDIICYSGHVALYIGNGQIVHASTSRTGIIIGNASYKRILTIRRIF